MYRRYFVVGLVFLLLVGAYFVFFDKDNSDNEYEVYFSKLVNADNYVDSLSGVDLEVYEVETSGKYVYTMVFSEVLKKESNIKVLVMDDSQKDDYGYYPSFGIIDNKDCSLVPSGSEKKVNESEGLSLTMEYDKKIEWLRIYFASESGEQFARIRVIDYLN